MAETVSSCPEYAKQMFKAICLCACIFIVGVGSRAIEYPKMLDTDRINFNGHVLPTTPDAYYFLAEIRDWVRGEYSEATPLRVVKRSSDAPLITKIAGTAVRLTGMNELDLVIWFPAVLASLAMAVLFTIYGIEFDNYLLAFCAGLVSTFPVDWFLRSGVGYFDSDCLNVPLFYLVTFFLYKSAFSSSKNRELLSMAAAAFFSVFLLQWWKEAGHILVIGLWTGWLFFPSRFKILNYCKITVLCLGVCAAAVYFAGKVHLLPDPLVRLLDQLGNYLRAANPDNNTFYDPFTTVGELSTFSVQDTLRRYAGHWMIFIPCAFGALLFVRRYRFRGAVLIIPGCLFLLLSLIMGVRFLIFAVPLFGIGMAYLSFWMCRTLTVPKLGVWVATILVCLSLSVPVMKLSYSFGYNSMLSKYGASLAQILRLNSGKDAKVWCWWSEGYFVQYFSNRWTVIDGGLQTPLRTFIASLPLVSTNYKLSANWIKLFAKHKNPIRVISKYTGSTESAVEFLVKYLSEDFNYAELLKEYKIPETRNWKKWLFPDVEAYLYLTPDLLLRNSWLTSGLMISSEEDRIPVYALPVLDLKVNKQKGIAYYKNIEYKYSKAFFVTEESLSHDNIRENGPILVAIKGSKNFYLINEASFQSLALQLLFAHPTSLDGFVPVAYHPHVGGVWRVK